MEEPRGNCRLRFPRLAAVLGIFFILKVAALAQVDQGRIVGTVFDPDRAVVPAAAITVKNERTGEERTTTTNDQGSYAVAALKPSIYTVKVRAPNFAPTEFTGVQVSVGQEFKLDVSLKPTLNVETITVTAGTEALIDTSSARMGANVNPREVEGLPLNGRQLSQLYLQAPGSVNTGSGTFVDIRFSGRSNEQNAIRYDGIEGSAIVDANPGNFNGEISSPFRLQTSLENVQEFRVESNNYPAEYGTGTGGQISVVSKSGSNRYHGSLFEYLRNDAVDARNFFDRVGKAPLRLNQFGGSFGGPIIKDKFFFFGSYEGYRLRSGINIVEAVPSLATRARAVPAIAPLIDAFRGPGSFIVPGASTNPDFDIAQLTSNVQVNENSGSTRFDYKINDRYSVYARYFRDQGSNSQPEGVTGRRSNYRAVTQNAVVALQGALSQTVTNEFKVGFNEALTRVNGSAPTVNGIDLSRLTINITGSVANNGIPGQGSTSGVAVPGGLIRGTSAFNGSGFPYTPYSLSIIDNLSLQRGTHSLKFGGEVRVVRLYTNRLGGTTYSYSNLSDFLANRALQIQYVADLSDPSPFNNGATGNRLAKQQYYVGYAQDEWKIKPNLTVNYGLRFEYYSPLREDRNLDVIFDTVNGTLLPPNRNFYRSMPTFGPRFAIAWSPRYGSTGFFGGGRTVVRAGFGIYTGPGQTEDQIQPIESDRIQLTQAGGAFPIDLAAVRANFIANPNNRQYQPRAYAPEYSIPERIYQYSLSIEQQLPYNLVLTAGYVGSQGRNLFLRSITNRIIQVRTNPNPTGNAIVIRQFDIVQPDGTVLKPFAEVDIKTSGGYDSYNALQVTLGRRFNTGLTLNSQYTYSKSFGNSSGSNDALTSGNPADFNYDRGFNIFDVRHSFNVSALYALPIGKGHSYLADLSGIGEAVLGGWEIGSIINARSGLPFDLRVTRPDVAYVDAAGNVFNTPAAGRTAVINTPGGGASRNVRRPDFVPGANPFLSNGYLNPAAFAIPKPGTFGNLERGLLHGPNFVQLDLIVTKRFPIKESANVEFRAEMFNLLNHANFANPPATLPNALGTGTNQIQPGQPFTAAAAGNFGVFSQTVERTVGLGTQRQIQFALRFNF